jgi:hypothetical protein
VPSASPYLPLTRSAIGSASMAGLALCVRALRDGSDRERTCRSRHRVVWSPCVLKPRSYRGPPEVVHKVTPWSVTTRKPAAWNLQYLTNNTHGKQVIHVARPFKRPKRIPMLHRALWSLRCWCGLDSVDVFRSDGFDSRLPHSHYHVLVMSMLQTAQATGHVLKSLCHQC